MICTNCKYEISAAWGGNADTPIVAKYPNIQVGFMLEVALFVAENLKLFMDTDCSIPKTNKQTKKME